DLYFQTGGARIHGRVWESPNSSATPLVILHGIWESWHTFADVAPRFAQKCSVYALDLRGHGESDKPEQGYSMKDYAADIESVLKQLPYSHVHLLGHSLGSLVAIQLAGDAPTSALLEKLILQDPPFVQPHQEADVKNDMQHLLELKRQPFEAVVAEFTSQPSVLEKTWFEMTARDFLQSADGPFLAIMNNELTTEAWATLLSRITTPTLFLAADPADGGWMGDESHALVRYTLPTAQIVDFPGCGHHIEATCTESFIATVEEFLDNSKE
ncbi:MAG TPA: alpha/beta hydrolase, partial [Ktedonobacteraceae bacterium]|nr:alpha/beta hydrolase [Ktedonobacteraceae bacterium]